MSRDLFTSWSDYQQGIDTVLRTAEQRLCIYDPDLRLLKLDGEGRLIQLKRLLQGKREQCLRIAVRNAEFVRRNSPRLLELLTTYGHLMSIVETPEGLSHLRDCLLLADACHGVIRFDQEQARSKLLIDEPEEVMPYQKRFDEIWNEGNHPITASTLGL